MILDATKFRLKPNERAVLEARLKEHIERYNEPTRSARSTGRRMQFNPRVREDFKTAFEEEVKAERERTGEQVTLGRL